MNSSGAFQSAIGNGRPTIEPAPSRSGLRNAAPNVLPPAGRTETQREATSRVSIIALCPAEQTIWE